MSKLLAVVTGSSSGIGLQITKDLLLKGYFVVGIDIEPCPITDKDLRTMQCNLLDVSHTFSTAKFIENNFGPVSVLVNCAGKLDGYKTLSEIDYKDLNDIIYLNLTSHVNLTKCFIDTMVENGGGNIVNITSVASTETGGGGVAYTSAKHGLLGFTKQLAVEYASKNIIVNSVSPGAIRTPMTESDFEGDEQSSISQKVKQTIPLGEYGLAKDVSNAVQFLINRNNTYIQGHNLVVDGGWSINHHM